MLCAGNQPHLMQPTVNLLVKSSDWRLTSMLLVCQSICKPQRSPHTSSPKVSWQEQNKKAAGQTGSVLMQQHRKPFLISGTDCYNRSSYPSTSLSLSLSFTACPCHLFSLFPLPSSLPWFCSIYDFLWNLGVSCTLMWAINQPLKRTVDGRRERDGKNRREAFTVV